MKALVLDAERKTAEVHDVPIPTPGPFEVLVQVHSVALNPIDPLYVQHPLGSTGRIVGSDFAGVITSLGQSVPASSLLKVGQKVAGLVQGACSVNDRPGAFAEYVVSPWDLVWRVADTISLEEASTINLCGLTAAQALFSRLELESPFSLDSSKTPKTHAAFEETNVLIYGASTSVGLFAAQLVHRSTQFTGRKIKLIGVASKVRWEMLTNEPYGYSALVEYKDFEWTKQIRSLTGGKGVQLALDCISEGNTVKLVSTTLAKEGKMAVVRSRAGGAWTADDLPVEPIYGAVWEGLGVDIQYQGLVVPSSPESRAFAVSFFQWLSNGGLVVSNPVRLMPGGLERIVNEGFALLGAGGMKDRDSSRIEPWMKPIAAEKLVYRLIN